MERQHGDRREGVAGASRRGTRTGHSRHRHRGDRPPDPYVLGISATGPRAPQRFELGAGERSDSHEASVVSAPADVAAALDVVPGADVIRRCRVYRDRRGIVAHSTSWIPAEYAELVPQLAKSARLTGGTSLQLIAQATGRPITRRIDSASAHLLEPADAKLLELDPSNPPTDPVVVMTAKFIDSAGHVVEYGVDLGGPGRTWLTESEVTQ